MTTCSIILAWEIHIDRGAWLTTVHGVAKESGSYLATKQQLATLIIINLLRFFHTEHYCKHIKYVKLLQLHGGDSIIIIGF